MSEREKPNLDSIFAAALEIQDTEKQSAFLDEQCGADQKLRGEVAELLRSHRESGSFMDRPAAGLDQTIDVNRDAMEAGLSRAFTAEAAVVIGDGGHSVLKSLGKQLASVPRVSLRGSDEDQRIVKPKSPELPEEERDSRYRLDGEIARGGMGAIIKGRDTDLGRDLAIKVLLDSHKGKPEVVERFVEEAQIGGQLQHPGIVPVYELGQFSDQRPFFSMKLIKGKTLAALLTERESPTDEQAQLLGIFEQVCQTMAYAHSRGVIHRDLKPANIMVGAFGEVQVMDWGLAKVLEEGGVADEKKSLDKHKDVSIIRTLRSEGSDSPDDIGSQTHMGSVMGTPAYMPPEQALGEIDRMDERADVFGLGAVLCEILTGKPPYVGEDGTQVFRQASRGKLDDCYERLDACGADQELVAIAKQATASEPEQRLRNGGALADAVSDYLNGVQERLKQAEIDRSQAQARAEEEGRRRKLHLVISAMTLFMAIATGLAANHFWRQGKIQTALTRKAQEATQQAKQASQLAEDARNEAQQKSERLAEQLQISTIARLAAQSANLRRPHPTLSSVLAIEAVERSQKIGHASSTALESLMNITSNLGGRAYHAHDAPIRVLKLSGAGTMASGDGHGRICLWDVYADNPGETVRVLEGHRDAITFIEFTPDNRWLVTASTDGDARRWDLQAADIGKSSQVLSGHTLAIRHADLSRNGRWLVTASLDKTARLWDLQQADPSATVRVLQHPGWLSFVHFALNDQWVMTRGAGGFLWDLRDAMPSGKAPDSPRFSFFGTTKEGALNQQGIPRCFSKDGRWMLTSEAVWRLHEDREPTRHDFDEPDRFGWNEIQMQFLQDEQVLVTLGKNQPTKFWEWNDDGVGELLRVLPDARYAEISPDARWMLKWESGMLVDLQDASKAFFRIAQGDEISAHLFTTDSRFMIIADNHGGIRIWDLTDDYFLSTMINRKSGNSIPILKMGAGGWLAFVMNQDVRVARLAAGKFTDYMKLEGVREQAAESGVVFSPDGRWLAIGSYQQVNLWDLHAEDPHSTMITLTGFEHLVSTIAFTPDGDTMATCCSGSLRLWDISSRDEQQTQDSEQLILTMDVERKIYFDCMDISSDGRWLATGDILSNIRLWDLQDPSRTERSWKAHDGAEITDLAFSPDASWLVTTGKDNNVRLWNPNHEDPGGAHRIMRSLGPNAKDRFGPSPRIKLFSPDGRSVFFQNGAGSVQRWTFTESGLSETPTVIGTPGPGDPLHPRISSDGRWLFVGVHHQVRRWDLTAENPSEESIALQTWQVRNIILSEDGRHLVTADINRLYLWPLDTQELLSIARERTGRGLSEKERRRYLE